MKAHVRPEILKEFLNASIRELRDRKKERFTRRDLSKILRTVQKFTDEVIREGVAEGVFEEHQRSFLLSNSVTLPSDSETEHNIPKIGSKESLVFQDPNYSITANAVIGPKRAFVKSSKKTTMKSNTIRDLIKNGSNSSVENDKWGKIHNFKCFYADSLDHFYRNGFFAVAAFKKSKKHDDIFERYVDLCDNNGIGYEDFINAQFSFFQKNMGRAPKYWELNTRHHGQDGVERAQSYIDYLQKHQIEPNVFTPRSEPAVDVSAVEKFRRSEQSLKILMKNFDKTEREILKIYATEERNATEQFFSRLWLEKNPVYIELKERGEI